MFRDSKRWERLEKRIIRVVRDYVRVSESEYLEDDQLIGEYGIIKNPQPTHISGKSWVEKPVYTYLRDDLEGVVIVGDENQPNLEEIAKLKPDLIIASKLRHEQIYDQLSQIAPTVTHETVYKFKETAQLMGQAMNREEEANSLITEWEKRVADFKEKISAKLGEAWPVEASVLNFRADHARIYVTGYAGDILEELGFVRSAFQQEEADKGTVVLKLTDKESISHMNVCFSCFYPILAKIMRFNKHMKIGPVILYGRI